MTNPIPEGMHSVTPALTLKNCAEALEFYKKAFGALEVDRAGDPSGKKIWHAAFKIGDSTIFCNDEFPEMGAIARPASLWIYGPDIDARFERAVARVPWPRCRRPTRSGVIASRRSPTRTGTTGHSPSE